VIGFAAAAIGFAATLLFCTGTAGRTPHLFMPIGSVLSWFLLTFSLCRCCEGEQGVIQCLSSVVFVSLPGGL